MSTSAGIYVFDGKVCVNALQVQSDGHPRALGKSIGEFFNNRPITVGIDDYFKPSINTAFNIMPQLTFHLQLEQTKLYRRVAKRRGLAIPPLNNTLPGQFYSIPTRPVTHFEYNYHLHVIDENRLQIGVYGEHRKCLFYGHLEGFQKFCKESS